MKDKCENWGLVPWDYYTYIPGGTVRSGEFFGFFFTHLRSGKLHIRQQKETGKLSTSNLRWGRQATVYSYQPMNHIALRCEFRNRSQNLEKNAKRKLILPGKAAVSDQTLLFTCLQFKNIDTGTIQALFLFTPGSEHVMATVSPLPEVNHNMGYLVT